MTGMSQAKFWIGRLLAAGGALVALSLGGCESLGGECLREATQYVQVCERREANGHCAHYSMKTRTYCAERAAPEPRSRPSSTPYSAPAASPAPVRAAENLPVMLTRDALPSPIANTVWRGGYTCGQGQTAGQLEIGARGANGYASMFTFYATDENPDVPTGSYEVDVVFDKERWAMTPVRWVSQPEGYVMVGASGIYEASEDDPELSLSGRVDGPGCDWIFLWDVTELARAGG